MFRTRPQKVRKALSPLQGNLVGTTRKNCKTGVQVDNWIMQWVAECWQKLMMLAVSLRCQRPPDPVSAARQESPPVPSPRRGSLRAADVAARRPVRSEMAEAAGSCLRPVGKGGESASSLARSREQNWGGRRLARTEYACLYE